MHRRSQGTEGEQRVVGRPRVATRCVRLRDPPPAAGVPALQKLTLAEVCRRTGGAVRPSSLASYESGRRSLRIDVVWVITRALGEDARRC